MTVREACEAYLRELNARNARKATRESYQSLFKRLEAFARDEELEQLGDISRADARRWRDSWTWAPKTQERVIAQLKAFFGFAAAEGWIAESPVAGFRPPKLTAPPTMPLSVDEMRRLLQASVSRPKEQALLLLMRYSGLAIGDATTLGTDSLRPTGELVLRRAKSGELVCVALPDPVLAALEAVAEPGSPHYFWSGRSERPTVAKLWRRRLAAVAAEARVEGFHPHRLRDTFAVELLLDGVLMQDVSSLLGHSSVATTERHYAPWNMARSERLGRIVRKVHQRDPILLGFTPKKPPRTATTAPGEAGLATHHRSQAARRAYA